MCLIGTMFQIGHPHITFCSRIGLFRLDLLLLFIVSLVSTQLGFASEVPPTKTAESLGSLTVQSEFPSFGGLDLDGNYVSLQTLLTNEHVIVISYYKWNRAPVNICGKD